MDVLKQVEEALVACQSQITALCSEGDIPYQVTAALTALRGLEWKPWAWLPIEQALDGVKLDMVGCHHPGTTKGWLRGSGYYKREAMETGFTHFVILPTPPKREVENA